MTENKSQQNLIFKSKGWELKSIQKLKKRLKKKSTKT